jgi:hypothetical protein
VPPPTQRVRRGGAGAVSARGGGGAQEDAFRAADARSGGVAWGGSEPRRTAEVTWHPTRSVIVMWITRQAASDLH